MSSFVTRLVLICVLTGASGCAEQLPTSRSAEESLRERIEKDSKGRIDLLSFAKTDGQHQEMFGVKYYAMEFVGEIEFTEDCFLNLLSPDLLPFLTYSEAEAKDEVIKLESGFLASVERGTESPSEDEIKAKLKEYYLECRTGERQPIYGSVQFEKKESGWVTANIRAWRGEAAE